jgi:hypothetical protein
MGPSAHPSVTATKDGASVRVRGTIGYSVTTALVASGLQGFIESNPTD